MLLRAYATKVSNPWYLQKKFGSPQWPLVHYKFRIWITRRIWNRIFLKCSKVTGAQMGLIAEQNQRTKISCYCPFKYWYSHYLNGQMCPRAPPRPPGCRKWHCWTFCSWTCPNILKTCSESSWLDSCKYSMPEPSTHCLKLQKIICRSFTVPESVRKLLDHVSGINNYCLV